MIESVTDKGERIDVLPAASPTPWRQARTERIVRRAGWVAHVFRLLVACALPDMTTDHSRM
ncbi:hypothetical protein ALI144C_22530 [Actinosynnema sp. ALI-1.44]|uniref:hypothetical protein n=1 Tax=Actinosynnema sp. ALI-1.44 TaxID=1933779 RepID=UPI00097C8366|nr:hypothetical protein [Actinosynnema sp. ALI-1.44]ONI81299.1 hypothetical protein ALI144C_22530 [Actinosynnema sp. ALI-1.44]